MKRKLFIVLLTVFLLVCVLALAACVGFGQKKDTVTVAPFTEMVAALSEEEGAYSLKDDITAQDSVLNIEHAVTLDLGGNSLNVKSFAVDTDSSGILTIKNGTLLSPDGVTIDAPNATVVLSSVKIITSTDSEISMKASMNTLKYEGDTSFETSEGENKEVNIASNTRLVLENTLTKPILVTVGSSDVRVESFSKAEGNQITVTAAASGSVSIMNDGKISAVKVLSTSVKMEIGNTAEATPPEVSGEGKDGIESVRVYKIAYQGNGGISVGGTENPVKLVKEGERTPSPSFTKVGYIFTGFSPALSERVTAHATYTAQYVKIKASESIFTFDENWGDNSTIDGYTAVLNTDSVEAVVVPERHNSLPVTKVDVSPWISTDSITAIYLSKNVKEVDVSLYADAPHLATLSVADGNASFKSVDGVLYNADMTELLRYPSAKLEPSFTVPKSVTKIGAAAFVDFKKDDIHVYSIDEDFIDATDYLKCYHMQPKEFAIKLINEIAEKLHIPATAGIGTNLYLAKIALDITAKKAKDHIGYLTEELYKETLWDHRPITDFWQVARGTANRLARYGIHDKRTEFGDFVYSSNNLETGSIGLNKYGKASISPVYSIFQPTRIADSDFLGRRLVRKDFINAMVKWRQGVIYGQWRIHESDFAKIEIAVPSVEEQRNIGAYLDNLDNLITLHQCMYHILNFRRY